MTPSPATLRQLGRTGLQVSEVGLGCMNFGVDTNQEESFEILDAALEHGINLIDTANMYGPRESEIIVGNWIASRTARDQSILCSKFHHRMSNDPNDFGNHRRHILRQCEESLLRLKTDHLDIYYIHRPQPSVPIDETLRALEDLVRMGKVLYLGSSTFAAWQVMESLWVSRELGLNRVVCEQPPYNLLDRRIERELIPMATTYGLGLITWAPLAGGLLTGKYSKESRPPGSRYEKSFPERRFTDDAFAAINDLRRIADSVGLGLGELALSWCLHNKDIHSVLLGPRSVEQFLWSMKVRGTPLDESVCAEIDRVVEPGTHCSAYYEASFGPNARCS